MTTTTKKKTVTIEFTIKLWQKMALLAAALLVSSYLMATCAHAQGIVYSCSSNGTGCAATTITAGHSVPTISASTTTDTHSYISSVDIGRATVGSLIVSNCQFSDGTPCQTKEKPKKEIEKASEFLQFWFGFSSILLLFAGIGLGVASFIHWYFKIDEGNK